MNFSFFLTFLLSSSKVPFLLVLIFFFFFRSFSLNLAKSSISEDQHLREDHSPVIAKFPVNHFMYQVSYHSLPAFHQISILMGLFLSLPPHFVILFQFHFPSRSPLLTWSPCLIEYWIAMESPSETDSSYVSSCIIVWFSHVSASVSSHLALYHMSLANSVLLIPSSPSSRSPLFSWPSIAPAIVLHLGKYS